MKGKRCKENSYIGKEGEFIGGHSDPPVAPFPATGKGPAAAVAATVRPTDESAIRTPPLSLFLSEVPSARGRPPRG